MLKIWPLFKEWLLFEGEVSTCLPRIGWFDVEIPESSGNTAGVAKRVINKRREKRGNVHKI